MIHRQRFGTWRHRAAFAALLFTASLVVLLVFVGTGSARQRSTYSIGVMYSSPQTDTWGTANISALRAATATLGSQNFSIKVVDNLPFGPQMTQASQQLFQQGSDLVVDIASAGALFYTACKGAPDKHCLELYPLGAQPTNSAGWWTDAGVMEYLEGVAAGKLTKSGNVGFVNAFKIPAQVAIVNQFALGCRSVLPTCQVHNVYINSFSDPSKEVEAANTLIDGGADVVNYWVDTTDVLTTASNRNVWSFGLYADQRSIAPKKYVTSFLLEPTMQRIFTQELTALRNGTWKCCQVNFGTSPGVLDIGLAPFGSSVPASVKAAVATALAKIKAGGQPYAGPIYDASGKLRVPKGKVINWRTGLIYGGWSWPVRGVVGG